MGLVTDITIMQDGRILGIGTDQKLYTRAHLNSSWVPAPDKGGEVTSITIMQDGKILGIGTDQKTLFTRVNLDSEWVKIGSDKRITVTDITTMPDGSILGIGPDHKLYTLTDLERSWVKAKDLGGLWACIAMKLEVHKEISDAAVADLAKHLGVDPSDITDIHHHAGRRILHRKIHQVHQQRGTVHPVLAELVREYDRDPTIVYSHGPIELPPNMPHLDEVRRFAKEHPTQFEEIYSRMKANFSRKELKLILDMDRDLLNKCAAFAVGNQHINNPTVMSAMLFTNVITPAWVEGKLSGSTKETISVIAIIVTIVGGVFFLLFGFMALVAAAAASFGLAIIFLIVAAVLLVAAIIALIIHLLTSRQAHALVVSERGELTEGAIPLRFGDVVAIRSRHRDPSTAGLFVCTQHIVGVAGHRDEHIVMCNHDITTVASRMSYWRLIKKDDPESRDIVSLSENNRTFYLQEVERKAGHPLTPTRFHLYAGRDVTISEKTDEPAEFFLHVYQRWGQDVYCGQNVQIVPLRPAEKTSGTVFGSLRTKRAVTHIDYSRRTGDLPDVEDEFTKFSFFQTRD
jgi:hypothetical protein